MIGIFGPTGSSGTQVLRNAIVAYGGALPLTFYGRSQTKFKAMLEDFKLTLEPLVQTITFPLYEDVNQEKSCSLPTRCEQILGAIQSYENSELFFRTDCNDFNSLIKMCSQCKVIVNCTPSKPNFINKLISASKDLEVVIVDLCQDAQLVNELILLNQTHGYASRYVPFGGVNCIPVEIGSFLQPKTTFFKSILWDYEGQHRLKLFDTLVEASQRPDFKRILCDDILTDQDNKSPKISATYFIDSVDFFVKPKVSGSSFLNAGLERSVINYSRQLLGHKKLQRLSVIRRYANHFIALFYAALFDLMMRLILFPYFPTIMKFLIDTSFRDTLSMNTLSDGRCEWRFYDERGRQQVRVASQHGDPSTQESARLILEVALAATSNERPANFVSTPVAAYKYSLIQRLINSGWEIHCSEEKNCSDRSQS